MAKQATAPEAIHKKLLTLPLSLHEDVSALAKANDRSVEAEIRVALRRHIAREKAAA